jgi:hypothetical protein
MVNSPLMMSRLNLSTGILNAPRSGAMPILGQRPLVIALFITQILKSRSAASNSAELGTTPDGLITLSTAISGSFKTCPNASCFPSIGMRTSIPVFRCCLAIARATGDIDRNEPRIRT